MTDFDKSKFLNDAEGTAFSQENVQAELRKSYDIVKKHEGAVFLLQVLDDKGACDLEVVGFENNPSFEGNEDEVALMSPRKALQLAKAIYTDSETLPKITLPSSEDCIRGLVETIVHARFKRPDIVDYLSGLLKQYFSEYPFLGIQYQLLGNGEVTFDKPILLKLEEQFGNVQTQ